MVAPGASVSFIQFDIRPPGTRFTTTVNGSPVSGELDIEYERTTGSPLDHRPGTCRTARPRT